MERDELLHYGVSGMKWGVRRSIGKKARQYVYAEKKHKRVSESIDRTVSKSKTRILSDRQKKTLKNNKDYKKKLEKAMNILAKDIEQSDIKQARSDLFVRQFATQFVSGVIGRSVYDASMEGSLMKLYGGGGNKRL